MGCITRPFRHAVIDGPAPRVEWPGEDAPWVVYDTALEKKRACNAWDAFPPSCRAELHRLLLLPAAGILGLPEALAPDVGLWGAGCHEMGSGGFLDLHLDSDRHAQNGLERRANAILFLSPWETGWGGELEFWEAGKGGPAVRIAPRAGRLVLFEVGDTSLHRVAPYTPPGGQRRLSLAAFWWGLPKGEAKRPRALFLPLPGEHDPAKDALRHARAA